MNLGLHALLLQVIVSIVQFQHGFRLCSAGEPGYLDFDNLPETNFSCQGKVIGGYYADVEAGCQMFHVCTIGQKDEIMDIKFLCLNGTVFDQETRVCERVDEVDCSKSERFYNLNLELYGNHAVTLSLHESENEEEDESSELIDDHESQRPTSVRPSTTSSTTTTSPRPSISSTTSASGSYQHPNGYPQHYQPQPRFPPIQTSQSKSLYDDKNGGYHHQYIYHAGDHRTNNLDNDNPSNNNNNNNNNSENKNDNNNNNNDDNNNNNDNSQATSYQLFSNQGVSSSTGAPQIHEVRYSSTPATQIQIHNDHQPTVSPIFHATSSTIQTLLNSNANSPALINPIFHNHGIASTTEQFTVHNNNPRETDEYRDDDQDDRADRRPLEAVQPTTQGKVSKLAISPIPAHKDDDDRSNHQATVIKNGQQQRVTTSFLPTPSSDDGQAVRSFYPTPRTSTKSSSSHVTHIHLPPPPTIPHLKPHQITINLPTPDIQRIVQNPSPLLPSQSRVIVTAKASVSDESGRSLNTTQLVTLPLPTIPASYDDYKEGDESFDPFYRDVPKIRNDRRVGGRFRWPRASREERSVRRARRDVESATEDETIIGEIKAIGENRTKEEAKVGVEKIHELEVPKIGSENEEIEIVDDKKNGKMNEEEKLKWENDEEKGSIGDEKSKTESVEVKSIDNVEDKRSGMEEEKPNVTVDLKTMSSSYRADSGETIDEKLTIDTEESDGDEYVKDAKSVSAVETDIVDLKTMSSRHRSDSGERVEEKSAIDPKESDRDEYVDDAMPVSAVETDMVDLKTISLRHHADSGDKVAGKSAIDTKESDGDEYVDDLKSRSDVATRESDAGEYVDTADVTFDRKIFNEPESQTSKEVDTRAVAEQNSKYSKDQANRFEKEDKSSNHEYSNGFETTKKGPDEESSRFSLLPEVVTPMKSHRRHPTKKLTLKERISDEEEDDEEMNEKEEQGGDEEAEEKNADQRKFHDKLSAQKLKTKQRFPIEEEDDEVEEEEEVAFQRKSHNKHSAKRLKTKQRRPVEEDEDEEVEEEEEDADRKKSHDKHSAKKLKPKQRLAVQEEEDEKSEEEEEFINVRKSQRKHSTRKSKAKQAVPEEEEDQVEEVVNRRKSQRKHSTRKSKAKQPLREEEEDQVEEVGNRRKSARKHSAKKSKKKNPFPSEEEQDEEDRSTEASLEKLVDDSEESPGKWHEERQTSDEKMYDERETPSEENLSESYDYYDSEMDSTSVRSSEDDSAEYSKESPNKIDPSSRHRESPHRSNSFKLSDEPSDEKWSHRRDKSRKFGAEDEDEEADYDFSDSPATRSTEESSSIEMSNDYVDDSRMSTSNEDSRDVHEDEEAMLRDDATQDSSTQLSDEVTDSTEKLSSFEDAKTDEKDSLRSIDDRISEGVLMFTDEIPSLPETAEPEQVESAKSVEGNSQDYIDDNYEPQSYKEREESSSTTEASMTENVLDKETSTPRTENEEHTEEICTTESSSTGLTERPEIEDNQKDEARLESRLPEVDAKIEKPIEKPIESDETTSADLPTSTSSTTTTSSTTRTSTPTTTTTTARPTPPKLFKPFTLRKTYVYSPPTTTPVPVVIKPRLALLNPKPAKPPKSYNDLAPKPVIRKTPLFARKTTVRTTTPRMEVVNQEFLTELPVGRTENSALEETAFDGSTSPLPTTEAPHIFSEPTVTVAGKMENENSSVKETEHSNVKDNQNSSTNANDVSLSTTERFELSSTMDTQTFTPYPLLVKMTEAAVAIEEIQTHDEPPEKTDISTMNKADVENNNVPSVSEASVSTTPEASTDVGFEEVSSETPVSSSTEGAQIFEIPAIGASSLSSTWRNHVTSAPEIKIPFATTTDVAESEVATEIPEITTTLNDAITNNSPTLASIRAVNRRPGAIKRTAFFNCLDKEMYRYYADDRDCRLFHFCSPGFTSRQVLDFRFVCEEGTAFDEESQSCIHDVKNAKCRMRVW